MYTSTSYMKHIHSVVNFRVSYMYLSEL